MEFIDEQLSESSVMDRSNIISWSELEQQVRNDIINSSTIHFSIENDTIGEICPSEDASVVGSVMSSSSDLSVSPCQKCMDLVVKTSKHHCDDDVSTIAKGYHSDNIESSSPLEILVDGSDDVNDDFHDREESESIGFGSHNFRSPISLSILELEPLEDMYLGGKCQGAIDDCFSPPRSKVLDMILTPGDEKKEDEYEHSQCRYFSTDCESSRFDVGRHPTSLNHKCSFKSRPAETGVFVMKNRNMAPSTFSYNASVNASTNATFKSRSSLHVDTPMNSKKNLKRKRHPSEYENKSLRGGRSTNSINMHNNIVDLVSCRCTKTQCLKLYCDCFQAGKTCKEYCECTECKNTLEESGQNGVRTRVIREILKRKPNAFQKKMKAPATTCACKSSKCLKKYCQCFVQGRDCTDSCMCQNCHNRSDLSEAPNVKRSCSPVNSNGDHGSQPHQRQLQESWSIDDSSTHSSSNSTNFVALDAMVESQTSSLPLSSNSSSMPSLHLVNKKGFGKTTTNASSVPPPKIPDIFKNAKTSSSATISLMNSSSAVNSTFSQLPPPEIPEVFLNTTTTGSVPPDVFTNPNFWLKTDNIYHTSLPWTATSSSHTSSTGVKTKVSSKK